MAYMYLSARDGPWTAAWNRFRDSICGRKDSWWTEPSRSGAIHNPERIMILNSFR